MDIPVLSTRQRTAVIARRDLAAAKTVATATYAVKVASDLAKYPGETVGVVVEFCISPSGRRLHKTVSPRGRRTHNDPEIAKDVLEWFLRGHLPAGAVRVSRTVRRTPFEVIDGGSGSGSTPF